MANAVQISGSLRNRLVLILVGGAALLALLLFFVIRSYATQIAQQGQDRIMRASVISILDAVAIQNGTVEIDIPYASFSMLTTASDDRVFYAIYQDNMLISGYDDLATTSLSSPPENGFETKSYLGDTVRVVSASRTLIGADRRTEVSIVLAQTQDALAGTLRQISRNAALFGIGFFAFAAALSFWAASTTIGQFSRLTGSVTRRGPQDLSAFAKPVPSEMAPLVTSLNSLMERLDHSLRQSEDFIAEAAHRVRTPLATVRSHAEATLQRVDRKDNRQALRSMIRAIDESSRAAGQLLDHAMITFRADKLERQDLELVDLVEDLVLNLTPIAEMRHLELRLETEGNVKVSGDPILLQNAVRNLIDNALKYSPSESVIHIQVSANPNPSIIVRDQGPGFQEDEIETLTVRFRRGQNANDTIGSGLGLTIANDVAIAHGGSLYLTNHQSGGACAILSF